MLVALYGASAALAGIAVVAAARVPTAVPLRVRVRRGVRVVQRR